MECEYIPLTIRFCIHETRFLWAAFQIEDICSQKCDSDIRQTLRKLPKDLPEIYSRIISRIICIGHAELAKKIFLWVATAQRPMLVEEIREAIAVEPHQEYSDRQRFINDMSQIVSWCGNLIVMDEEDGTVQFTHQTVKTFLLDGCPDKTNVEFHFQQAQIDLYAGEICVTYLNFNDFKRKLIKQPKALPLPAPEAILDATLSSGLNSKPAYIWGKLAQLRKRYRGQNLDSGQLFNTEALRKDLEEAVELQKEHPFLSYASEYWLHHSAYFDIKNTKTSRLWERLLFSEDGLAQIPWESNEWAQRTRKISEWICNHDHVAIFAIIISSKTPFADIENLYILDSAIERSALRLLECIFQISLWSNEVVEGCLVKAAGVGCVAPPTQGTWRSDDYVSAFRLVDAWLFLNWVGGAVYVHIGWSTQTCATTLIITFPISTSHSCVPLSHRSPNIS